MCGICGVYSTKFDRNQERENLGRMCDAIRHRGPDGQGQFIDDHVALGHLRLSIIDLESGDQPMFNEDQSIAVVFNGEIYNYRELREELLSKGHTFTTSSDTEVIVHSYEEFGEECVKHFIGMFSIALWDRNRKKLFLARDRMGEKPLYYRFNNSELMFASELKSLLAHNRLEPEINMDALEMYMSYGYIPEPYSILKNVHKLPAAHWMTLQDGRMRIESYWQLDMNDSTNSRNEANLLDEFEELLQDSINKQLRSDVPVGAFLSGGTDSNLIVSLAAEASTHALSTFSVGFSDADNNELKYARLTADRYKTNHHEIMIDQLDPDLFPKIVRHFDEPFADSSAIPTYYVAREAARHVKVCLSGDAGDELFCGYERYNFEPFENLISHLPLVLRRFFLTPVAGSLPDSFPGKGWLRRQSSDSAQRWQRMMGPFDYHERIALYRPELHHLITDDAKIFRPYFDRKDLSEISRRMLADQKTYLPDDILVKVDRNSMWHGLEVRVPFLDHRIVEFANNLPLEVKKKSAQQKYPIRKLLEQRVDKEILLKPKTGFGLPIKHWLSGSMKDFTHELLEGPDTRIHQWFDSDAIESLVRHHNEGKRDLSNRVWTLLWLEQWCREFGF